MNEYDISSIFKDMEDYLLSSMSRNMQKHTKWENDENFQWEMWQVKQLEGLNEYRKRNKQYARKQSGYVRAKIEELLRQSNEHGGMEQEIKILEAIKKGFKPGRTPKGIESSFFKVNERKLNAMIKSIDSDMKKASTAMLRMTNDEYRKTIFKAQVFANTGTMTTDQAIDMATKDFLSKGINCIEYKDGKRVNIASYAEMAIRTANQRAYLQGEGAKRDEWGIHTVLISRYGACSEICLPWQGKVYIDDVYSGGTAEEADKTGYPLLSTAIAGGLFHPNCKHIMTTFFEGISTVPKAVDVAGTRENSNLIATQRYNERMIRKYKRLEKGSLDEQNKAKYSKKVREWQAKQRELMDAHPEVHRNYKRESLRGITKASNEKIGSATEEILDSDGLKIPDFMKNKKSETITPILNDEKYVDEVMKKLNLKTNDEHITRVIRNDISKMPKTDIEFLLKSNIRITEDPILPGRFRRVNLIAIRYQEIRIGKAAHNGTFAHEFAHYVAYKNKLYEDDKFINTVNNALKDHKIKSAKLRNNEYIIVESNKFVSRYQGRTYIKVEDFNIEKDIIKVDDMREYISVGYQCYIENPSLLYEKDEMLYNYFKEEGLVNGRRRKR